MPEITTGGPTDVLPLPTLEKSSPATAHIKSNFLLFVGLVSGLAACYLFGFELFQPADGTSWQEVAVWSTGFITLGAAVLWFIGLHTIDWWALVLEYWWFSMPIAGAVGFLYVRAEEGSVELGEKS